MAEADERRALTLIALLRRAARQMVAELIERLDATGYPDVSPAWHPVFENIDPNGTRLTTLAARADMTHQSVGEVVQALEERGYVERVPDPTDRRARLVRLTDRGRLLVTRARIEIAKIEGRWRVRLREAGWEGDLKAALAGALANGIEPARRR